eukprot:518531-Heterocapsa_arctica.AAC.1
MATGNYRSRSQAKGALVVYFRPSSHPRERPLGNRRGLEHSAGPTLATIHGATLCWIPPGKRR